MDGIIAEGLFTNNNNLNVMATEHFNLVNVVKNKMFTNTLKYFREVL